MLHELRIENLLLMERAELRLGAGLNMLTGETGAGKTLLAHALDLLLGGRARKGIVRRGAREAYVEGVFALPAQLRDDERLPAGAEEVVVARRVWPDGRTRAYVCGRAANQADLHELGNVLLSFYGQHEHRKLMLSSAQLDVLDAWCGPEQQVTRDRLLSAYERARRAEGRMSELAEAAGARERELDLVRFELEEIEAAEPTPGEEGALVAERDRLRHLEALHGAALGGAEAIAPEAGGGGGAVELLALAVAQLEPAVAFDPRLATLAERAAGLRYEAEDVARELRSYLLALGSAEDAAGPARLEQIEERLAVLHRLERKHGGSIEAVLAHAERCRARRHDLEHAEEAMAAAEARLRAAQAERDELARRAAEARRAAAPGLSAAVRERLAELAMPGAEFSIRLTERQGGCGPRGADTIEMLIASHPGVAPGPLREVASGGELSRVMLALLGVAHGQAAGPPEQAPLLVFDEIDAGIGGHTARAVGEHLRALARGRQILCITHLPQVAALADRHFAIVKDGSRSPATTTVIRLEGDGVVGELVRMLGGEAGDGAAGDHARELLRAA